MRCAEAIQKLKPAQADFALRYYRWCLKEATRELDQGFPCIRRVRSSLAFLFLDFAQTRSREELRSFMAGGLKRFNPLGAELAVESVTSEENLAHEAFVAYFKEEIVHQGEHMTRRRTPPRVIEILNRELAGKTNTKFNKKILKQELRQALEPLLGQPDKVSALGLQYCLPAGGWYLTTSLDLSGKKQLYYSHWLSARRAADLCPTELRPEISPLSWCGIHRGTAFDLIEENEVSQVAAFVGDMCRHVLEHLAAFLPGLPPEIPETLQDSENPLSEPIR